MKKRNYFKKSLAILLSLMMIMGTMVMIPLTTSADDSVPEEAASKWIEVGTAEELAALKDAINAYEGDLAFIRLTADIEVGAHTPINGTNKPVYFDGQNYKLINMTIGSAEERAGNTGLFQSVRPGSTIMNVHFVGAKVYSGKSQGGGILLNDQNNGITVVNVTTDETSLIDHNANRVGGLIGRIYGGDSFATTYIGYCVNNATVINSTVESGKGDAAGIVGATYGCYNIIFDHCINKGAITSTTTSGGQQCVAGISGRFERGGGANHVQGTTYTYVDCYNVGTLSATGAAGNLHMGGVSGLNCGYNPAPATGPATTVVVERCFDYSARVYNPTNNSNSGVSSWGDGSQVVKYVNDCYAANVVDSTNPYTVLHGWGKEMNVVNITETNGVVTLEDGDTDPLDNVITLSTGESTLAAEMKRIDDAIAAGVAIGSNEYLPLIISNMEEWKAFCAMEPLESDKNEAAPKALYVELKCDLDLSAEAHTPIQVCKYSTLVFNGNNHVIKGLNVGTPEAGAASAALFYRLGYDSVISNLHFVGARIYGKDQMTAVVANSAYAGIKMYNVSVDATSLVVGGGNHTGGLIGRITIGDVTKHTCEFVNCANAATITGPVNVGGFIGNMYGGNYSMSFKNCINTGALTTTATSGNIGVGGFFAMHDRGTTNPTHTVSFENCINTGAMSLALVAPAESSEAAMWAGGLFGCLRGNHPENGSTLIIKNCFDYSKRDFSKTTGSLGGVGALAGNADNGQMNKYVNGNAAVNAPGSVTTYDKVWGFTISNTTIENNYNTVAESLTAEITLGMDGETAITSTVKAEMEAINNGVYATLAGLKGTGTETDPIVIASAKDAANFSKFSANFMGDMLYVHMTASLDFANVDFAPIKLNVPVNFNGADTSGTIKSIKNLALDGLFIGGFFEILPAGSVVKNVNFKNISITNTRFAGILAGATYANITVENVYVEDTCYVQGEGHVGGIIGGTYNEQTSVGAYTFKNIVSAAKIQATGTSNAGVGGIIGFISRGATTLDFENCVRMNEMRYELEGGFHNNRVMGGMIGKTTYDAANNVEANFTNCVNLSDMVANGSIGHIGGLVGWLHFDKVVNIDHCFVAGTYAVTGSSSTYFKGLIANHADAELAANVTDSYALLQTVNGDVNAKYDNENLMKPKTEAPGIKSFVNSGLVADVNAKITLTGEAGATPESTIAAEVAAILELAHPVHYYAGNCDEHCDMCTAARTVDHTTNPHKYTGGADGCDEWCDTCFEGFREIDERAHLYANKCATECKTCGHTRDVVPHANAKACATACPDCKEALVPTAEHAYDNTCDTDCNNCSETRTIEHTSAGACDEKCDVCDAPLTPSGAHVWANDQDTDCDVCGATRTVTPPADDPAGDEPAGDEPAGDDKPADDEDETTAAPADDETTAKDTVKADTTEPAADEGCASSVAGIGALLALTASFGFALVGKKKED